MISVAATAPAFAASCVRSYDLRLDWGNSAAQFSKSANGNSATASATGNTGSVPLLVTFGSQYIRPANNNVDRRANDNLTVPSDTNIGGLGTGERALMLRHVNHGEGRNYRQVVTISFARAVTDLRFTISDVDSLNNVFYDRVELDGVRTATRVGVVGVGLNEPETNPNVNNKGPWRSSVSSDNEDIDSGGRNVSVTYASVAANTPITLTYWSSRAGSEQYIFLSDFTFKAKNC